MKLSVKSAAVIIGLGLLAVWLANNVEAVGKVTAKK